MSRPDDANRLFVPCVVFAWAFYWAIQAYVYKPPVEPVTPAAVTVGTIDKKCP